MRTVLVVRLIFQCGFSELKVGEISKVFAVSHRFYRFDVHL